MATITAKGIYVWTGGIAGAAVVHGLREREPCER